MRRPENPGSSLIGGESPRGKTEETGLTGRYRTFGQEGPKADEGAAVAARTGRGGRERRSSETGRDLRLEPNMAAEAQVPPGGF